MTAPQTKWFVTAHKSATISGGYGSTAIGAKNTLELLRQAVDCVTRRKQQNATAEGRAPMLIVVDDLAGGLFADEEYGIDICYEVGRIALDGDRVGVELDVRMHSISDLRWFNRRHREAVSAIAKVAA